jgi:hypothetical protein
MAQDPYTVFSYANSASEISPITLKAGVAHHRKALSLKGNFDLEWSSDLGFRPRLGLEWRPLEVIALRGGCWMGGLTAGAPGSAPTVHFTAGIGVLVPLSESHMEFGYALLPDRFMPGGILHQVSLTGKFL